MTEHSEGFVMKLTRLSKSVGGYGTDYQMSTLYTDVMWNAYTLDNTEYQRRIVAKMPSDWRGQLPAGASIQRIEIGFSVIGSQTATVHRCTADHTALTAQAAFAAAGQNVTAATKIAEISSSVASPLQITDATAISVIGSYGILFDPTNKIVQERSYSASSNYITVNITATVYYIDPGAAPVVTITSPVDLSNRLTTDALTVSWTYAQEAGSPQTAYKIETSTDGGATWTIAATASSTDTSYTFPANTFSAGMLWIRVTASSAYADSVPAVACVKMRMSPSTSNVTCDGKPVPTVSWTGADQTAYQVRFDTWDSGARFGTDTSLKVPRVYADGVYPVTVRTQTSNGEWSEWAETVWAEIENTDPGLTVSLTAVKDAATVLTAWPAVTGAAWYVLERDGVQVYAGTGLSFRDELAVGSPEYRLLAVTSGGYYTATDPVTVPLALRCDMLRPLDDDTAAWIRIRWSLAPRSRSYDRSVDTTFRHYAGRPKPVAISSGAVTRTMRTTAAYKTRAEAEKILALAGRPVVYKDVNGGRIIGILNPTGYDSERVFSLDISVTEIDWPEEADYVPAE